MDTKGTKHEGAVRGFYWTGRAYYAASALAALRRENYLDEVMLGLYHKGEGTTGEFAVRWMMVGGEWTPRLEVFSDAWAALPFFADLMAELAKPENKGIKAARFVELLKRLGMTDRTRYAAG